MNEIETQIDFRHKPDFDDDFEYNPTTRKRAASVWQIVFLGATVICVVLLMTLLIKIVNDAFGYVAMQNKIQPAVLLAKYASEVAPGTALSDLPKETLTAIFKDNVSAGLYRRYDREKKFDERTPQEVYALVQERVLEPKIVATWGLIDSLLNRGAIEKQVAEIPNGTLEFRSWINAAFITNPQSPDPEAAGVRTAILGSLWMILITILVAFPIGVGAAIYLEEYAVDNRLNRLIQTNINNLAGVPSIIYGMLGLAVFVRVLEPITSGVALGLTGGGDTSQNGRTILSAALTLALLVLPVIIINSQEAIRAVPRSLRQASYGLGATKWQTVWNHVLPNAMPGILTGTILAVSRAIGETAPLIVIGASTFITVDPGSPFSKFTALPVQIYQWASRPQAEFRNLAAAAIVVLLIMLLTLNAAAIIMRNRYSQRRAA